jgi:hypothetical protein
MGQFLWYRANGDGSADVIADSPELSAKIDADPRNWFSTPEEAIRHGGVVATAFVVRSTRVYDAARWFETGEMVNCGEVRTLEITAEPGEDVLHVDGEMRKANRVHLERKALAAKAQVRRFAKLAADALS